MFRGKNRKPLLKEAAIEICIVGDYEDYSIEQIVDGTFVNVVTGYHLIGNAGNFGDFRRDRNAGIFEPLPGAENFVDPPGLTVIFEEADPEFYDLVTVGADASGFYIHDGGDELWPVIGWMVFCGPRRLVTR